MKNLLLTLTLIVSNIIFCQTLDATFGNVGIATEQFTRTSDNDRVNSAALQSDGKIVFAGKSFIARVNQNGQLDTSFNGVGFIKLNTPYGIANIATQNDDKILVSGVNAIFRYNSDGSLDTTFDDDGVKTYYMNTKSIVVQNDGKIIIAGYTTINVDFAIIRLNTDGSYDTSFSGDGYTDFNIGFEDYSFDLKLQDDGKIIATGQTYNGVNSDFATIRTNADGSLDTTFGDNGIATVPLSTQDYGRAIAIQTDGKILIMGTRNSILTVLRYNSNGLLDTSFDDDGILTTAIPIGISFSPSPVFMPTNLPKIKQLLDGKILISVTTNNNFALIGLNSDGTFDTNFGDNNTGIVVQSSSYNGVSNFLLTPSADTIITGGISYNTESSFIQMLQYHIDGTFENSSLISLLYYNDRITDMIIQSDNKITTLTKTINTTLRRFTSNGTVDTTFGTNGKIDFDSAYMHIKNQNDTIFAFDSVTSKIFKLNSDGIPVSSFGTNGLLDFTLNPTNYVAYIDNLHYNGTDDYTYILFDYNESIDNTANQYYSNGILRVNNQGGIDPLFGIKKYRFNYFSLDENEYPVDLSFQSDGKIILINRLYIYQSNTNTYQSAIGVLRLNSDGTLDTSFGSNGKTITNVDGNNIPKEIALLQDDSFIINSSSNLQSTIHIKYNSNGIIDTAYGTNGIVYDSFSTDSVLLQNDGKLLKSGQKNNHFGIVRYNSDGTIDSDFGENGYSITPINTESKINALKLTPDAKLIAGGYSKSGYDTYVSLAKYTGVNLGRIHFSGENSLLLYPNPIVNRATFEYNLNTNQVITIALIDLQGKEVKKIVQNQSQTSGNHTVEINLENSEQGVYFLRFSSENGQQSVQFIKK